MTWVWAVLGVVLVGVVIVVLVGFFYLRPRAQQSVTTATKAISAELHGRPPRLLVPAQCRAAEVRDPDEVVGLGVLAVTDHAVLFGASSGRVVIMSREGLSVAQPGSQLVVTGAQPAQSLTLSIADPQSVMAVLGQ